MAGDDERGLGVAQWFAVVEFVDGGLGCAVNLAMAFHGS